MNGTRPLLTAECILLMKLGLLLCLLLTACSIAQPETVSLESDDSSGADSMASAQRGCGQPDLTAEELAHCGEKSYFWQSTCNGFQGGVKNSIVEFFNGGIRTMNPDHENPRWTKLKKISPNQYRFDYEDGYDLVEFDIDRLKIDHYQDDRLNCVSTAEIQR